MAQIHDFNMFFMFFYKVIGAVILVSEVSEVLPMKFTPTIQFHGLNWWFTFIIAFTCIKDFPCLLNSKYAIYMFRLSTYKLLTYISLLLFSLLILRWTLPLNFSSFHSFPFDSYLLQLLLLPLFTLMKVWYLFPP